MLTEHAGRHGLLLSDGASGKGGSGDWSVTLPFSFVPLLFLTTRHWLTHGHWTIYLCPLDRGFGHWERWAVPGLPGAAHGLPSPRSQLPKSAREAAAPLCALVASLAKKINKKGLVSKHAKKYKWPSQASWVLSNVFLVPPVKAADLCFVPKWEGSAASLCGRVWEGGCGAGC